MTQTTSSSQSHKTRAAARADLVDELLGDLNAPTPSPLAESLTQPQMLPVDADVVPQAPHSRPQPDVSIEDPPQSRGPQKAFSTRLPADVIGRARSAVYHTPGMTLSMLVAQALEYELRRLELERGAPYPELGPDQRIKTGRPVGK